MCGAKDNGKTYVQFIGRNGQRRGEKCLKRDEGEAEGGTDD